MSDAVGQGRFWAGFWRLADPKISITSAAALCIGATAAARDGYFHLGWLAVTLLALFCVEVAKNAWGDVFDFDNGTDLAVAPEDRTPFSGGKRVLVDGLLSRRETWGMAWGFGGAGLALGVAIVFLRAPEALWIGVAGAILGWSYHGPPLRLAYRGFGELDVVVCYGPLIALAGYLIQARAWDWEAFWLSLPLGLLIAAFLWVNEFPDYHADKAHAKKNLVVRLGRHRASRLLPLIHLTAYAILAALPFATAIPALVWLGFAGAPPSAAAVAWTWRDPDRFHRRRPVQALSLLAFVAYAAGVGVGLLAG